MIITLTGESSFALRQTLRRLTADFIAEYGDMGVERLDGEDASVERLQEALQSLPFLASKKLVVLQAPSKNKPFAEKAEQLLSDLPEITDVIIVEPKLDKRLSYYKFLKSKTDFREFHELDPSALAQWLTSEAKRREGSLSAADARYLVERVGANQQLLHGEIEKLLLYEPAITRASINLLTEETPQSTIFQLLEAAFAGQTKRALELYDEQRRLKVEPIQIIAMLAWQLHVLALIKAAGNRPAEQVAKDAKLNPFVVRKSTTIARRLELSRLRQLIADLLDIDLRLKRQPLDADEALQNYLLRLS